MIEAYLDKLEQACRAKGIDKFEIRYQCEANAALQVYEQKVSDARDNSSESVSLVVLQDGKKAVLKRLILTKQRFRWLSMRLWPMRGRLIRKKRFSFTTAAAIITRLCLIDPWQNWRSLTKSAF